MSPILAGSLMPQPGPVLRRTDALAAFVLVASVPCASLGCRAPDPPPPSPADTLPLSRAPAGDVEVTVKKVIDGDTIRVTGVGRGSELVRLIGIDAPETGEGRTVRECYGREAERWLAEQLPRGSRLRLVFDVEQRDRYGRLLAHVYRSDGTLLKTDGVDHADDHFFPRDQDIAWDIAGFCAEFRANPQHQSEVADAVARAVKDRHLPRRMPFYAIAYRAYQLGYAQLAAIALGRGPDSRGFQRRARRFREELKRLLGDRSG